MRSRIQLRKKIMRIHPDPQPCPVGVGSAHPYAGSFLFTLAVYVVPLFGIINIQTLQHVADEYLPY
jgi:hypothetical protein